MKKTTPVKPVGGGRSEDEERLWWDEHDPSEHFTQPAEVIVKLKSARKRMISVRIDEALHQQLKAVAQEHGLPYQRLMRELLRQSLANLVKDKTNRTQV